MTLKEAIEAVEKSIEHDQKMRAAYRTIADALELQNGWQKTLSMWTKAKSTDIINKKAVVENAKRQLATTTRANALEELVAAALNAAALNTANVVGFVLADDAARICRLSKAAEAYKKATSA